MSQGIGDLDAHLIAATALAGSVRGWARDPQRAAAARALKLAHHE